MSYSCLAGSHSFLMLDSCHAATPWDLNHYLVALSNVELHDPLLALVEDWGRHRQALPSVILLPQEPCQLLEGTGFVCLHWVNVAALGLSWVIQFHLSYQEWLVPGPKHNFLVCS